MTKELWKGNEAISEAAIRAGCRCFFGYPITPQNEIPEYMSVHMPKVGGVFVQSESEVSAINMVYGAAGTGTRVMTSSSSPGMALKQEGISYLCGANLPCVIVNISRGGPGLGTIQPAQSDYYQATRGGGNGDYRLIVLAPASIQEACDFTAEAFDLAEIYRMPVMILADGMIGQMMEAIEWRETPKREIPAKDWAAVGTNMERKHNVINSLFIDPDLCSDHNERLQAKYDLVASRETRYEYTGDEDAELILVAYGTPARLAKAACQKLKAEGIKVGVFRPISLWPFPSEALHQYASKEAVKSLLTLELSMGQMIDDVKLAVNGVKPVHFIGKAGGIIPKPDEILNAAYKAMGRK